LKTIVLEGNSLGAAGKATVENPEDLWKAPLPIQTIR